VRLRLVITNPVLHVGGGVRGCGKWCMRILPRLESKSFSFRHRTARPYVFRFDQWNSKLAGPTGTGCMRGPTRRRSRILLLPCREENWVQPGCKTHLVHTRRADATRGLPRHPTDRILMSAEGLAGYFLWLSRMTEAEC
jgi:hypothetical protein